MLIGHSLGGLVIETFLIQKVVDRHGSSLAKIRQVVTIATPHLGSGTLSGVRDLVSRFSRSPQEVALRAFSEDIGDMRARLLERIIQATVDDDDNRRIPVRAFAGNQDAVVTPASARGSIPKHRFDQIEGDHFSVHQPSNRESLNYKVFKDCLLNPAGHDEFWEVAEFVVELQVEPLDGVQSIEARHGGKPPRVVDTDNKAFLRRWVSFSATNRCERHFPLNYGTREGGWVDPKFSHKNRADPQRQRDWDDHGVQVFYEIEPQAGEQFSLEANIYKGFDKNNRNAHFHLSSAHYELVRFRLDLSAFVSNGWEITDEPNLYWNPGPDHRCGDVGSARVARNLRQPLEGGPSGVREWEMRRHADGIEEGVIDMIWDVGQVESSAAGVQP